MPSKYWVCDNCGSSLETECHPADTVGAHQAAIQTGWAVGGRPSYLGAEVGSSPDLCPRCRTSGDAEYQSDTNLPIGGLGG